MAQQLDLLLPKITKECVDKIRVGSSSQRMEPGEESNSVTGALMG